MTWEEWTKRGVNSYYYGGFTPKHPAFDKDRYARNQCQLCERPTAIRCSDCQIVLDPRLDSCPTCGVFYSGEEPPQGQTHRLGLAFCTVHADLRAEAN
jgi:hypothetical protein